MRILHTRIGIVLMMVVIAFTATEVFSAKNFNTTRSNTIPSIVNQQVGDILISYGIGGAEINVITDVLAVGISEVDFKATLIEIGIREEGVQEIFSKLDELGAGSIRSEVQEKISSIPSTEDISSSSAEGTIKEVIPNKRTESALKAVPNIAEITNRPHEAMESDKSVVRKLPGRTKYSNITLERAVFHDASKNILQKIRVATPEEREGLLNELRVSRKTFQAEILSMSLKIREDAKELRENFRERVKIVIGHVDHGKTARIAVAHGRGLRMINRFRSATVRFDQILNRLESRIDKLGELGFQVDSFFDVETSIEEAKNISIKNKEKLEQLKAKYESLLEGENSKGIGEEARAISQELKTGIENLHTKLGEIVDDIKQARKNYNSSMSNVKVK